MNSLVVVGETGTETAAVMGSASAMPLESVKFIVDHPSFLIHERTTGRILFLGRVAKL
jgi:serine protease inhibitor